MKERSARVVRRMVLKRDIYIKLLEWKNKRPRKVLELEGARQVGKTFILDLFSREYQTYIYINMIGSTGQRFLQCLEAALAWEPGQIPIEKPLHKAFKLYQPDFHDDAELLVVIDEIQESPVVYSKIREFSREFQCHFIVAGSYLGKTREKDYFLSAGDVESLTMTSLTFPEFLDAFEMRDLYEKIDLYRDSNHADYDKLKNFLIFICI